MRDSRGVLARLRRFVSLLRVGFPSPLHIGCCNVGKGPLKHVLRVPLLATLGSVAITTKSSRSARFSTADRRP